MEKTLPIEELLYEEEGTLLDFKREQYQFSGANEHQKSELLKDILSFSNAWRRYDAYILIGVEEVKGGRSKPVGIIEELDDAQLQQFVNCKTQRPIDFTYQTVLVDEMKIGVIRIPTQTRPFYLAKDYGKLKRHKVYIRRGSSTDEASPEEVRDMGRTELNESQVMPNLSFEFASSEDRKMLGTELDINALLLNIPKDGIPEFRDESENDGFNMRRLTLQYARPEYYRELARYYHITKKSNKLEFSLRNDSNKSLLDVRVEISVKKQNKDFYFFLSDDFPRVPSKYTDIMSANYKSISDQIIDGSKKSIRVDDLGEIFWIEIPFDKIQPKQTVFFDGAIFIAAHSSFVLEAETKIYADNIPIPIEGMLRISCNLEEETKDFSEIDEMHQVVLLQNYTDYLNECGEL